mmetsp:Transcript_33956/g.52919  ORF Transcript_33956/g.52919 Transcript_33956/m.52919 type:complete len:212 (+) Transcript_33956:605-1240(+)
MGGQQHEGEHSRSARGGSFWGEQAAWRPVTLRSFSQSRKATCLPICGLERGKPFWTNADATGCGLVQKTNGMCTCIRVPFHSAYLQGWSNRAIPFNQAFGTVGVLESRCIILQHKRCCSRIFPWLGDTDHDSRDLRVFHRTASFERCSAQEDSAILSAEADRHVESSWCGRFRRSRFKGVSIDGMRGRGHEPLLPRLKHAFNVISATAQRR